MTTLEQPSKIQKVVICACQILNRGVCGGGHGVIVRGKKGLNKLVLVGQAFPVFTPLPLVATPPDPRILGDIEHSECTLDGNKGAILPTHTSSMSRNGLSSEVAVVWENLQAVSTALTPVRMGILSIDLHTPLKNAQRKVETQHRG